MSLFIIENESRFSEEILEDKSFEDKNIYKISIKKECENKNDEVNHYVKDSLVGWHCYYREFSDLMKRKIKKSKRKDFLVYQMNLREHPNEFLRELKDIIVDNENYFDENDYSTTQDYLGYIEELTINLKSNLSEKTNFVLQYLYDHREDGINYDIETILKDKGYRFSGPEIENICEILKEKDYAKVSSHSDGASARINANGILFIENDEIDNSKNDVETNQFEELLHHIDSKFVNLMVEVNLNAKELAELIQDLADLVEEINQNFNNYSKPALSRLVRMRLAEYFMSESLKEGVVRPLLKDIAESIVDI